MRTLADDVLQEMLAQDDRILDVGNYSNEVHFRMMARIMGVDEDLAPVFREWMRVFNDSDSLAALNRQPYIRRRLSTSAGQRPRRQNAPAPPRRDCSANSPANISPARRSGPPGYGSPT